MSPASSEKLGQERLPLNDLKRSLETSPPELRQPLAYVLHLRSHWKPERRAKLIVPTSWMAFLAFADGKCGVECAVDRSCPFRNVRFESVAETRLVAPEEELPRDVMLQLLTDFGADDCLATLVTRAFEGIPRTRPRSDVPATRRLSQGTSQRIDLALVQGHERNDPKRTTPESNTWCLLLGMKAPTSTRHSHTAFRDSQGLFVPEELTPHAQRHLTRLASLIKRGATPESFPEWLVLFGLVYDAHRVRIVAYVPHRTKSDVVHCDAHVVDELALHPSTTGAPACELVFERLRFLLALTTLRRHVRQLSKSLSAGSRDGIGRVHVCLDCSACDQDHSCDSGSLYLCGSLGSSQRCSSEYSTCPSSIHARELDDVPVLVCGEEHSSSCRSFTSSFCSTCSSLSESVSTFNTLLSGDSKYTNSNYMEPSTSSRSQGERVACPNKLTETKRWEIIAWAREVIPTEHPVKDSYQMVISHSHPRRQRVTESRSSTRR